MKPSIEFLRQLESIGDTTYSRSVESDYELDEEYVSEEVHERGSDGDIKSPLPR